MKKKIFLLAMLAAVLLPAGKALVVQVLQAQLLAKPDFLSGNLSTLKKGTSLEVLETKGGWCLVKGAGGLKGYVHQSALAAKGGGLSGIAPGSKGTSQEELALAAKGFNEGNEKQLRGSRGYDFAAVDWVMAQGAANPEVGDFVREGKLK